VKNPPVGQSRVSCAIHPILAQRMRKKTELAPEPQARCTRPRGSAGLPHQEKHSGSAARAVWASHVRIGRRQQKSARVRRSGQWLCALGSGPSIWTRKGFPPGCYRSHRPASAGLLTRWQLHSGPSGLPRVCRRGTSRFANLIVESGPRDGHADRRDGAARLIQKSSQRASSGRFFAPSRPLPRRLRERWNRIADPTRMKPPGL